ncbi:type II secretion system F family protein [Aneurinibacillus aneurinilyticus]|jgi:Flp pilus assembly protein TadB|uniref:type II secretion system F family protein n=1 Tax=Aneurinibacillus aneurinilyticus TaxID=1391 RepID=UPI0023F4C7A0|nr:type II secretion system F family protein [Aneurinibacillus aneurinilyticus]
MEGILVFFVITSFVMYSRLKKRERDKQMEAHMEGHYRYEKKRKEFRWFDRWNRQLFRAGFSVPSVYVPYLVVMFSVGIGALVSVKMGNLGFGLGLLLGPFLFDILLNFLAGRSEKRFVRDFDLSLDVGASIIRSHGTILHYIDEVPNIVEAGWFSREMKEVKKRTSQGVPVAEAFQEMAERVDIECVHYAAQAMSATSLEGANMAAIFEDIKMMINRSDGAEKKAKSKTVELRRMGYLLISLTFLVPLYFRKPLMEMIALYPFLLIVLIGTLVLNAIGAIIVLRAVKIRV